MRSSLVFLVFMIACESACTFLLDRPTLIPGNPKAFIDYYFEFDCKLIQYSSDATEYNPQLFYKLRKQNSFLYQNREFSDSFHINSRGFRDDEASLIKPSIMFLGDSYTLGWGVKETETYCSVVEKLTGLKGLNMGMSSYGTARESLTLSTVDQSATKWIVWQYCHNDNSENETFISNNFNLPVRKREELTRIIQSHEWVTSYFPGKHFLTILKLYKQNLFRTPSPPSSESRGTTDAKKNRALQDAEMFLRVVASAKIDWNVTKVIVIDLNPKTYHSVFLESLQELLTSSTSQLPFKNRIFVVDLKPVVKSEDYYKLDVHLTKEGNYKIGNYLAKTIKLLEMRDSLIKSESQ